MSLKSNIKVMIIPVVASLPLSSCMLHVDRSHWTCKECHRPRSGCRSWWNTALYHPLGTKAGCKCRCLTCWGSGQTPPQKSADTVGPGCRRYPAALVAGEWCSLGHPGGSLLGLENTSALDSIQAGRDHQFLCCCGGCKCVSFPMWYDTMRQKFRASHVLK